MKHPVCIDKIFRDYNFGTIFQDLLVSPRSDRVELNLESLCEVVDLIESVDLVALLDHKGNLLSNRIVALRGQELEVARGRLEFALVGPALYGLASRVVKSGLKRPCFANKSSYYVQLFAQSGRRFSVLRRLTVFLWSKGKLKVI